MFNCLIDRLILQWKQTWFPCKVNESEFKFYSTEGQDIWFLPSK